jgi:hypothetical protein
MFFDISIKKANLPLNNPQIIRVAVDNRRTWSYRGQARRFPFWGRRSSKLD